MLLSFDRNFFLQLNIRYCKSIQRKSIFLYTKNVEFFNFFCGPKTKKKPQNGCMGSSRSKILKKHIVNDLPPRIQIDVYMLQGLVKL